MAGDDQAPGLIPWTSSTAPKGSNPGGLTRNERRFRRARDADLVPEAIAVLKEMLASSRDANIDPAVRQRARMDFMKCMGLVKRPTDAADIEALAAKLIDGMLAEGERRAEMRGPEQPAPVGDVVVKP